LDDRLVEFCGHPRHHILPTQHLPYTGPNSLGLLHLLTDGRCIIIVLRKQATKVFEHLDPFQYCFIDGELTLQGKDRGDSRLLLEPSFYSDPAFLRPDVSWVPRVHLHAAPLALALGEVALCQDNYPVKKVEVPKVGTEHPSVL
jgi:hypothetical protein